MSDYFTQYKETCEIYIIKDTVDECDKIYPRNGFFILILPFSSNE